jgi:hypothetical protein
VYSDSFEKGKIRMQNEEKGKFLVGFLLGSLFGIILLFLWGTKEGKKIVKLLAEKGELLEEDIEKKISELEEKGEELAIEGESIKKTFVRKAEKIKKKITPEIERKAAVTAEKLKQVKLLVEESQKAASRKYFKKNGKMLTS